VLVRSEACRNGRQGDVEVDGRRQGQLQAAWRAGVGEPATAANQGGTANDRQRQPAASCRTRAGNLGCRAPEGFATHASR
jgi:hypothetical protein